MEEFAKNCRFIFTCNHKNRIIEALHSRCTVIDFKLPKEEKPKLASAFLKRMINILKEENVEYDEKVLAKLLMKHFPDYRRVLNELQRYSVSGKIDEEILAAVVDIQMEGLLEALREKDFKKMRTWVVQNVDSNPPSELFRKLYDVLPDKVVQVPQLILILADYAYKSAWVADQELNLVAALTEIMASVEIK
jgi:DNA polymerase III gamma/tau subunit